MNPQEISIKLSLADLDKIREQVASKQRDIDALHDDIFALRAELAGKKLPGEPTVTISASQFWEAAHFFVAAGSSISAEMKAERLNALMKELAQKLGLEQR